MNQLEISHISKSFDGRAVLRNVNLTLAPGETVALLGVSGGGKTTLFNIIAGLLMPDEGDVRLNGESILGCPGRISYMLQKDLLLPHKTVIDNIALPLVIRGMKKREARAIAAKHLKQFGLDGYEKKHPHELSGGMRQRAALLRTYLFSGSEDESAGFDASNAAGSGASQADASAGFRIALLDEPFSALDTITRSAMHIWYLSVMEELQLATLFITHDIDEAILLADRVAILSRDKISVGSPALTSSNVASEPLSGTECPAAISHIIPIENRPAKTQEYLLTEDFLCYKRQIIDLI